MRLRENGNAVQIEPSQIKGVDYVIRMKNSIDFGYDADDPANRHATALRLISAQCPSGQIVSEESIDKGAYATGRAAREYFVRIKCS